MAGHDVIHQQICDCDSLNVRYCKGFWVASRVVREYNNVSVSGVGYGKWPRQSTATRTNGPSTGIGNIGAVWRCLELFFL